MSVSSKIPPDDLGGPRSYECCYRRLGTPPRRCPGHNVSLCLHRRPHTPVSLLPHVSPSHRLPISRAADRRAHCAEASCGRFRQGLHHFLTHHLPLGADCSGRPTEPFGDQSIFNAFGLHFDQSSLVALSPTVKPWFRHANSPRKTRSCIYYYRPRQPMSCR